MTPSERYGGYVVPSEPLPDDTVVKGVSYYWVTDDSPPTWLDRIRVFISKLIVGNHEG